MTQNLWINFKTLKKLTINTEHAKSIIFAKCQIVFYFGLYIYTPNNGLINQLQLHKQL